jgi:hypothetical protein
MSVGGQLGEVVETAVSESGEYADDRFLNDLLGGDGITQLLQGNDSQARLKAVENLAIELRRLYRHP